MSERPDLPIALVTGGSRGIGAAIAEALAAAGARVVVAARSEEGCRERVRAIEEAGGRAWPLALDVTDASAPERVASLAEELGRLDWLVNNAGMAISAPLVPRDADGEALYQRHLDLNFHAARRLTQALLPGMKERGYGRVVNVASSAGLRGYAYVAAYCASKFALVGYTLAAAAELANTGVTVNAICPHYVDSPMLDASIARLVEKTGRSEEEARAFFRGENPGGELVTPAQVAAAVLGELEGEGSGRLVELDGSASARVLAPGR